MHSDSDSDLLAQWRSGDSDAYAALVSRHYSLVLATCLRQAAPGDGEDCAQAVFLVLSRRPAAAAHAPALAAWLLRVAGFVCRTSRRTARRRERAEQATRTAASPDQPQRPEALDHLDDCLAKLNERQRSAITLHFLYGKSPQEVASTLGTSRDNAYQLISRGLAGLRTLLAKRGVALTTAGLTSLLTSEAAAATTSAPAAVLATLTTTPSLGVASLAKGAMTTMTITTLAPVGIAALVLASSTLTWIVSAEGDNALPQSNPNIPAIQVQTATGTTAPASDAIPANPGNGRQNPNIPPTSAPNAGLVNPDRPAAGAGTPSQVAGANGLQAQGRPAPQGGLAALLEKSISLEVMDAELEDVVMMINRASGLTIVLDDTLANGGAPPVTLAVSDMKVRDVLASVEKLTGLTHAIRDDAYLLLKQP